MIYLVSFVLVFSVVSRVQAEPFSLGAVEDITLGNDARYGPDSSSNGSGLEARDIPSRRHVVFISYDISALQSEGLFSNVSFSHFSHDQHGETNVYGVIESLDLLEVESLTWNAAPGVQNNPTPALDSPIELDFADLTDVLLTFSGPGQTGVRFSTDTSEALADFLNSDKDGIVTFVFAASAENNQLIVRSMEHAEGGSFLEGELSPTLEIALNPNPVDEAANVIRDVVLSWTPGVNAYMHDVYFGTNFDDVNDATTTVDPNNVYQGRQVPNRFPISGTSNLEFGQTYYWRIDEVSSPPDLTIYKGNVWQFTVEPIAYPVPSESITATASSYTQNQGPENTINGSGLDDNDLHSTESGAMWLSSSIGAQPTWIQYEFDKVYKLHEMWVWNSNTEFESFIGFGLKDVTIEYSANGTDWMELGGVPEFAQAPGASDYAHNTTVDFSGAAAKYVKITANSHWGLLAQYGLSEVRFLYIPVQAREPSPDSGATDVALDVILGWRAGREADTHDVYLSSDEQAVIDGTALVTTVTVNSYSTSLDLDSTYYWRIDEVNEAETPTIWQGEIWSFTTPDSLVVDDFEDYNDYPPDEIFSTWIDGYGTTTNGSMAGYAEPDFLAGEHFVETTIVHGGSQSMPLFYENNFKYSEATMTLSSQRDWTIKGVGVLSLWFYGDASNAAERMYVALNGSAVVYHDNPNAAQINTWTEWPIDLQEFAAQGVNLANVNTITIGFGDKNNLQAGGSGMVFFDDIRLYRPRLF